MDIPWWIGTMFECPICGSHYWGTSFSREVRGKWRLVKEVSKAHGYCNGWYIDDEDRPRKCEFVWNRSEDEWVFVPRTI